MCASISPACCCVDFLVENKLTVELKACVDLEDVHLAQAMIYLEAYKYEFGLLITFGARSLQFKRLMNRKYKRLNSDLGE